jgi:chromosome segregation ATPase
MDASKKVEQELEAWRQKLAELKERLYNSEGEERKSLLLERVDIESRIEGLAIELVKSRAVETENRLDQIKNNAKALDDDYARLAEANARLMLGLRQARNDLKQLEARLGKMPVDEGHRELKRLSMLVAEFEVDLRINERLKIAADVAARHARKRYKDAAGIPEYSN